MAIEPTAFLSLAQALALNKADEAAHRSAVSRAYYGALHACLVALPSEFAPDSESLRRGGSHKATIDAMAQWGRAPGSGRLDAQQAARRIGQLKRHRVTADYKVDEEWEIDADKCVAMAAEVLVLASLARGKRDKSANLPES